MGRNLYWFPADTQKPTVVLIHNTWSNYRAFRKHIKLVNELGFPCVAFDLDLAQVSDGKNLSTWFLSTKRVYKVWEKNIAEVLEQVPGDKIIYSFSGPAISAFLASEGRTDIRGIICDGGPFDDIWQCTYRLFEYAKILPTKILRLSALTLGVWQFGLDYPRRLRKTLNQWPTDIPILSIRGDKDPIAIPEAIEKIFSPHAHLNITRLHLPEGTHLDGLKNFPDDYIPVLSSFLTGEDPETFR